MTEGVALSISQFLDAWRIFGRACAGTRTEHAAGVDYIFTGLPIPFFNVAVLTSHFRGRAGTRRGAMHRRRTPLAVDRHARSSRGGRRCHGRARRLRPRAAPADDGDGPSYAHVLQPRLLDGLQLEVPEDDGGCGDVIDVNSAAYGMDLAASKPAFGRGAFWANHVAVLGRTGGVPATSAAVMLAGRHRYVALVATHPTYQKRGFAEAAMRHALSVSAERFGGGP
jgi:hypothetical protein